MSLLKRGLILATVFTIVACGQKSDVPSNTTGTQASGETAQREVPTTPKLAHKHAAWAGKWIGVEGMFVDITPLESGQYSLVMQSDLDTLGTYKGADSAQGIEFTRGNDVFTLRKGTGDETGLKYLAGKTDCLVVASGEGYCRN